MGVLALPENLSFENQSVLITGSNTGIGFEFARLFLRHKAAAVYLVVRTLEKGNKAIEELKKDPIVLTENPNVEIKAYECDQGSVESVRNFAKKFKEEVKSLNVAVLNAGVNYFSYIPTVDGWDTVFQVNYLDSALIGLELLPLLRESGKSGNPSHLFFTSSLTHKHVSFDTKKLLKEDLNIVDYHLAKENWPLNPSSQYSMSKLCLTAFTQELAQHETDVIVTCACPGVVVSELDRGLPFWIKGPVAFVKKYFGRTAYIAAEALTPAVITEKTGTYWADGVVAQHCKSLDTKDGQAVRKKLYEQTLAKCKEIDPDISLPA